MVPNTGLLDNHQEELAVAMERQNYLVRGDVKCVVRFKKTLQSLAVCQKPHTRDQEVGRLPHEDVAVSAHH